MEHKFADMQTTLEFYYNNEHGEGDNAHPNILSKSNSKENFKPS